MMCVLQSLLAVTLLSGPEEVLEAEASAVVSEAKPAAAAKTVALAKTVASAKIMSRTCDIDVHEGVVMFEGEVVVSYSADFTMCAEKLYMFMSGTNELSRVVAVGAVSITNESRVGTCGMATYRRKKGEIEMFGDEKGMVARLSDGGDGARSVEGTRIRFWIDTQQVEVENSKVSSARKGGETLL